MARPVSLNSKGEVVGSMRVHAPKTKELFAEDLPHAFLWRAGMTMDLGTLGGYSSEALDINDKSQVVGWSLTSETPLQHRRAFLWQDGRMRALDGLPDEAGWDEASGINNRSQVAGAIGWNKKPGGAAFIWQGGKVRLFSVGYVCGMNDRGELVGNVRHLAMRRRQAARELDALLWRNGTAIRLPLPGPGWIGGRAYRINDAGLIVGSAQKKKHLPDTTTRALLWKNGRVTVLPTLGGEANEALEINNSGDIVGWSQIGTPPGGRHAFLFTKGVLLDLNKCLPPNSGWMLSEATAINDRGQIAGVGSYRQARTTYGFLLTPVR
jgi:probable HAF family extracellular repeat protein